MKSSLFQDSKKKRQCLKPTNSQIATAQRLDVIKKENRCIKSLNAGQS